MNINLEKSLHIWILNNFPYDKNDASLCRYIENMGLADLLINYLNWASRFVSAVPRRIERSSTFNRKVQTSSEMLEIAFILDDINKGNSLHKYLSRGVETAICLPNENGKLNRRDLDLMLNEWGVHHLHLSITALSDGFVARTNNLLLAFFTNEVAYIVDILPHNKWTDKGIIETIYRDFPKSGAIAVLEGIDPPKRTFSENEHRQLRNSGVHTMTVIGGKVVIPVTGYSMDGTNFKIINSAKVIFKYLKYFEDIWWNYNNLILKYFEQIMFIDCPKYPVFKFDTDAEGQFGIVEEKTRVFIKCGVDFNQNYSA